MATINIATAIMLFSVIAASCVKSQSHKGFPHDGGQSYPSDGLLGGQGAEQYNKPVDLKRVTPEFKQKWLALGRKLEDIPKLIKTR